MANRRIIILDRDVTQTKTFNVCLWAVVPASRVTYYAALQKNFQSAFIGADPGEVQNLQTGLWTEKTYTYSNPTLTGNANQIMAAAQAEMQADWQKFQTDVNAYNPWNRYGTTWDDTGVWTPAGAT